MQTDGFKLNERSSLFLQDFKATRGNKNMGNILPPKRALSSEMLKLQSSCFRSEQVAPSSKSGGMRLCFLFPSMCDPPPQSALSSWRIWSCQSSSPLSQPQSCVIISKVLFKSVPALHQDVFYMLILRDIDPSLLRRCLMPGVPETAGKTVSA